MENYLNIINIIIPSIIGIIVYVYQRQKIKVLETRLNINKGDEISKEYTQYIRAIKDRHDEEMKTKTFKIETTNEKLTEMYYYALSKAYLGNYAKREEYFKSKFSLCGIDLSEMVGNNDEYFINYFKELNPHYSIPMLPVE